MEQFFPDYSCYDIKVRGLLERTSLLIAAKFVSPCTLHMSAKCKSSVCCVYCSSLYVSHNLTPTYLHRLNLPLKVRLVSTSSLWLILDKNFLISLIFLNPTTFQGGSNLSSAIKPSPITTGYVHHLYFSELCRTTSLTLQKQMLWHLVTFYSELLFKW